MAWMTEEQKKTAGTLPLQGLFSGITKRYDLMNRLLTLRLDESWRGRAARECLRDSPPTVVDLCTGTGDLLARVERDAPDGTEVYGIDFSMEMLAAARAKADRKGGRKVSFVQGDAGRLPVRSGSVDVIGIAFAFRNLTYRNRNSWRHLAEIYRVLKPGGKLVIVETSQPRFYIIRKLVHLYHAVAVGWLGAFLSGHRGAYRYLADSARNYYSAEELKGLLLSTGFSKVEYARFLTGAAALHRAVK